MKLGLILLFMLSMAFLAGAQTCVHTSLSKKYNYKVTYIQGQKTVDGSVDSKLIIQVISKANRAIIQTITIQTGFLYEAAFQNCNNARSLMTGWNRDTEVIDSDLGDLVIADLNFDRREDIAIKRDSGGASGPTYEFYLQNEKNAFVKDDQLTEVMRYFPLYIDPKQKTLTTDNASGVYWHTKRTFKYSGTSKRWELIKTAHVKQ